MYEGKAFRDVRVAVARIVHRDVGAKDISRQIKGVVFRVRLSIPRIFVSTQIAPTRIPIA